MEHLTRNDFCEYIDGTLDPERRRLVDAHIEGCERCAGELRLSDAIERAAGMPPVSVSPEFTDAVMMKILAARPESAAPRPAQPARRRFALPVAVGLGYLTILVIVGMGAGAPEGSGGDGGWIGESIGFVTRHAALFTSLLSRKLSGGEGGVLTLALMTMIGIAAIDSLIGKKTPRGRT